jgi:hypothetical protein
VLTTDPVVMFSAFALIAVAPMMMLVMKLRTEVFILFRFVF